MNLATTHMHVKMNEDLAAVLVPCDVRSRIT